jgi:DNA-binding LacI/PurR family transcriptional regulator
VAVGRDIGRNAISSVVENIEAMTELAFEHLRQQGSRHPVLAVGTGQRSSEVEAPAVYRAWARGHGIEPEVFELSTKGAEGVAFRFGCQLWPKRSDIDGIFAPFDATAAGLLRAAQARGRRIPQDVRIVTTESPAARRATIPLTTVDFQPGQLARQAVRLLLEQLRGEQVSYPGSLEPMLLVRESSSLGSRRRVQKARATDSKR